MWILVIDKASKLKHSKPFKDCLWSEFEEVDNLVSNLLEKIQSELHLERFNKTKYKSNLKVLLLNLFVTYSVSSKMYLSVPRGAGDYSASRYNSNNIGYKVFIKIFDALTKLKYIEYTLVIMIHLLQLVIVQESEQILSS